MPPLIWQNEYPAAEALRPLAAAPSLTAALSARGAFSVRLLGLGETQDCAYFGGLGLPETLFCRRVLLCVDGCAVVEAESARGGKSWPVWAVCRWAAFCFQAA